MRAFAAVVRSLRGSTLLDPMAGLVGLGRTGGGNGECREKLYRKFTRLWGGLAAVWMEVR
jgi:hypothetical protein